MTTIHTSRANKDYPEHGIKKGDTYYWWQFYKQPRQMSATPPSQSQTTSNPKLAAVYEAVEALEADISSATCPSDFESALQCAAETIRGVVEEYQESISNMSEAFQGGSPLIEEFENISQDLEDFAQELDDAAGAIAEFDFAAFIDQSDVEVRMQDDNPEASDEKAEELATNYIESVTGFEDLHPDDKDQAMEELRSVASGPQCPV